MSPAPRQGLTDQRTEVEVVEQPDAVASLREFVAVAVHDLRGAQGALLTAAGLLASAEDDASRAALSACIERETAHLGRLIDDLFLLSVADTARLEVYPDTVELEPILREAATEGGDGAVEVHGAAGMRVYADPCHVRRIVANLVHNAVRHGAPPVRIIAAADDGRVEVRVTDDGPGVPKPFVPHLFARFARAGGAHSGAGLGLAIVAELAQLNGGSADYQPHDAGRSGATFVIRLPQRPGCSPPARTLEDRTGRSHTVGVPRPSEQAIERNRELAAQVLSALEEAIQETSAAKARSSELRISVRESMRTRRRLLREGAALADEPTAFDTGFTGPGDIAIS